MRFRSKLASHALLASMLLAEGCSSTASPTGTDGGRDASVTGSGSGTSPRRDSGTGDASARDASVGSGSGSSSRTDAANDAPPDAATPTPGLTKVATGEYETFYLKDGIVYGYGAVTENLGLGSYQGVAVPPMPILTPAGLTFLDVQGGLHQSMALDVNHRVWTWGVPANSGSAAAIDPTMPYMVTTDDKGNVFDGIAAIQPTTSFDAVLKQDGTVWVWGNCANGITGDGTNGPDGGEVSTPTQVPIPLPSGVTITKIAGAVAMLALASDGSVWAWGFAEGGVLGTGNTDGTVPRQVMGLPSDIVEISAGGSDFFYALTSAGVLYGWGYRNPYLGIPGYAPVMTPISLSASLPLPKPVKSVGADSLTTHVILSDGTLWGWGDAACGTLGDGEEPNWNATTCGWDFMSYDMMVYKPVQIAPGVSTFTQIFSNSAYDFYVYAQTSDQTLYSWGRNKTCTLGNGVVAGAPNGNSGTAADIAANHPNSWDVPLATAVTPFTTAEKAVLSPCCPGGVDASGCQ